MLIDLPAAESDAPQTLQMVYAASVNPVVWRSKIETLAPRLLLRAKQDDPNATEIPMADLVWRLHVPTGYEVVHNSGTVVTDDIRRPLPAAIEVAGLFYYGMGGHFGLLLLPSHQSIHDSSRSAAKCCMTPTASQSSPVIQPSSASPTSPAASVPKAKPTDLSRIVIEEEEKPNEKNADDSQQRPAKSNETLSATAGKPHYMQDDVNYFSVPSPPSYRALAGVRSLKIHLEQTPEEWGNVIEFHSLGVEPRLAVTMVSQSRFSLLALGVALAVGLIGVAMTRRTVRSKLAFLFVVAVAATLLPWTTDSIELMRICNAVFYADALLVPYYLVVWSTRWCWSVYGKFRSRGKSLAVAPAASTASVIVSVIVILVIFLATCTMAADGPVVKPQANEGPLAVQVVEATVPLSVPDNAVVVPYDPETEHGVKDADKLLVPYEKYVELWNLANPDKKIEAKVSPAPYALAGAQYQTTLEGEDSLLVTGQMEFDVFDDASVQIPLRLGGGVLAQAQVDGKPARLSVATIEKTSPQTALPQNTLQQAAAQKPTTQPPMPQQVVVPQQAVQQQAVPPSASEVKSEANAPAVPTLDNVSMLVLHASGKGRHTLQWTIRLKLVKQGGWRVVQCVLPASPATSLTITALQPQTEIRLIRPSDHYSRETQTANEVIHTSLGADGSLSLQWRPKVNEGQVDPSLTADSTAVLDVQEDGLRLNWQMVLEFRRSQHDRFTLALPAAFLVEKVEGSNVRGWEVHKTDAGQTIEVVLLQPAKDREQFNLVLWRAGAIGGSPSTEFDVPAVSLSDASLQHGKLTIRRSPLIELRTLERSGVSRTDLSGESVDSSRAKGGDESPLGIRPFEAYNFSALPFSIRLAASPVAAKATATVQTVLRIAEYERTLESRVAFDVQNRPVYQLQMLLPSDFQVEHVAVSGVFQYAVTQRDQRSLLTIYLADGRQGNVPVLLRGRLGHDGVLKELPLPNLQIEGVERQQGDVAVQVDPAFDVDAADLRHCEKTPASRLYSWLEASQQPFTRVALHYAHGDYGATLRLASRKADVVCDTITNVRVTDRAVETTILLDFNIREAGIRNLSFLLPAEMADSRIFVPMLRQKTVEPVDKEPGSPVRVKIELQDDMMDELRVLVENDHLLTPGSHEAPVPCVEQGRMNRRYVAIESTGRDSVQVENESRREMDVLGRHQKEWESLKEILGREMTLAYLVESDAQQPRLVFHMEQHAAVETVDARIGLAETTLVLDANGAYRAQQVLHVDNRTEQFLEIRLPEGASLWAAKVADEPVKPTVLPGAADNGCVRIPLIKTAAGDLYYDVTLKYGGRMSNLGILSNVTFPLIHCVNIREDLSQVRLYLPEKYRWFNFGGSMRSVATEAELQSGYIQFQTQQTEQMVATLREGDQFAKLRAAFNLKSQQRKMDQLRQSFASYDPYRRESDSKSDRQLELQVQLQANSVANKQADQEVKQLEQASQQTPVANNRKQLTDLFQVQKSNPTRNVLKNNGDNWSYADAGRSESGTGGSALRFQFDREWFGRNQLADEPARKLKEEYSSRSIVTGQPERDKSVDGKVLREISQAKANAPAQPSAVQVELKSQSNKAALSKSRTNEEPSEPSSAPEQISVNRYKDRLEKQSGVQGNSNANADPFSNSLPADEKLAEGRRSSGELSKPMSGLASTDRGGKKRAGVGGTQNSTATPSQEAPSISFGGMAGNLGGAAGSEAGEKSDKSGQATDEDLAGNATVPATQSAGLASLDFEIPQRGLLCRFTVPRGAAQITAQACSSDLLQRLTAMAATIGVALLAWLASRWIRKQERAWLSKPITSTLLICLGLVSLCTFVPVLGLLAVVAGCSLKLQKKLAVQK
jgi:hypothetical protein